MKFTLVLMALGFASPAFAQMAQEQSVTDARTVLATCEGHAKYVGHGAYSTRVRQWDGGFEKCEALKTAVENALAARDKTRAEMMDNAAKDLATVRATRGSH